MNNMYSISFDRLIEVRWSSRIRSANEQRESEQREKSQRVRDRAEVQGEKERERVLNQREVRRARRR